MNNSPKIYIIQRNDGKYYNHKEKWFTSKLCLSSYSPKRIDASGLIKLASLIDCEVKEITEEDWTRDMASITTATVIKLDSIRKSLDDIRYMLPTISGLNRNLKNFLTKSSEQLKMVTPIFKEFVEKEEDKTDDVKMVYDEFISELASLEFWDYKNMTTMIKSYKKDPKSINGICNKILK